jgi:ATP-binding cassette, subfamily B (MDR/TAP), member 1
LIISLRLATDASTVRTLVVDTLTLIVQNIATVAAELVIAFSANWILSFVVLAVSPLMLIQGYIQMKFLKGFSADAKVGLINNFFLGIPSIEMYTCIL